MNASNVGENKDFEWVAGQLAACHAALPLCETVFLLSEEVTSWVCSNSEGRVSRKSPEEEKVRTFAQTLEYFYSLRKRERGGTGVISYALLSSGRLHVDDLKYEEWITLKSVYSRCRYLQGPVSKTVLPQAYILRLEGKDGLYTSSFSLKRKAGLRPVSDLRLFYKLLIPCKILVQALQITRKWRVLVVETELTLNDNGDPWISDIRLCRVQRCSPSLQGRGGKNALTVKVETPVNLLKDKSFSSLSHHSESSREDWLLPAAPRLTLSSNLQAYHPDFKEVLVRQFAKSQRRVVRDFEELFNELEEKQLKEAESPFKAHHSRLSKREKSLHFDLSLLPPNPPSIPQQKRPFAFHLQALSMLPNPAVYRAKRPVKAARSIRTFSLDRLISTKSHREVRLETQGMKQRKSEGSLSGKRVYRFIKTSHGGKE